jgi:hypothetical protein
MKLVNFLILFALLISACTPAASPVNPSPTPTPAADEPVNSNTPSAPIPANPYAPQPGDDLLARSSAFMGSSDLLSLESFPVQIMLILSGNMPTPCHSLRAIVHEPDEANNIEVEIYSVADPGAICAQVLHSFEVRIPLGSYPPGHYTVSVNGQRIGDFNS